MNILSIARALPITGNAIKRVEDSEIYRLSVESYKIYKAFGNKKPIAKAVEQVKKKEEAAAYFSTHYLAQKRERAAIIENAITVMPKVNHSLSPKFAMDSVAQGQFEGSKNAYRISSYGASDELLCWYISQSFIGYQACALISQQWLVKKACVKPAQKAIKKGWKLTVNDGSEVDDKKIKEIQKIDKRMKIKKKLVEFNSKKMVFGIRIAIPVIEGWGPEQYKQPFNIDGIKKGAYKGMTQVDPHWMVPELDAEAVNNPASMGFYEPTYWRVNDVLYHHSHLIIVRNGDVPDILKPTYQYGGLPLPQLIYERIYAAERTANEAPLLAMDKRLTVLHLDLESMALEPQKFEEQMAAWAGYRDNFGIKVVGVDETIEQFDTSLADLDNVIMTQYQLVAAIAEMPATELLETSPKGFNATGEFEENSWYDRLEAIQEDDYDPFLERHYELLIKSEFDGAFEVDVTWEPMKSPTPKELAEIGDLKSRTDTALSTMGAIDGVEVRERLIADEHSGYNGLAPYTDAEVKDMEKEKEDAMNAENGGNNGDQEKEK